MILLTATICKTILALHFTDVEYLLPSCLDKSCQKQKKKKKKKVYILNMLSSYSASSNAQMNRNYCILGRLVL